MDTPPRVSTVFFKGRQLLEINPIALRFIAKNLHQEELTPIEKTGKTKCVRVASPKSAATLSFVFYDNYHNFTKGLDS